VQAGVLLLVELLLMEVNKLGHALVRQRMISTDITSFPLLAINVCGLSEMLARLLQFVTAAML
jgi:hypothetical protein